MEPPSPLPSAPTTSLPLRPAPAMWLVGRLPWWSRVAAFLGGSILLTLLGTARWLEPSPQGFGTHQQLGLPECRFQTMFEQRCPACGMTTSWSHLMRGHPWQSLTVNAGGTVLGVLALVAGPWLVASALRGRWCGGPPNEWIMVALCVMVTLVIITDWMLRLFVV